MKRSGLDRYPISDQVEDMGLSVRMRLLTAPV